MSERLHEFLMKMPRANLIGLLYNSLDVMQGYNGHSRWFCIQAALGSDLKELDSGGWSAKYPTLADAKRNNETYWEE